LRKLEGYDFEDAQAKADFDQLLAEYENIRDSKIFANVTITCSNRSESLRLPEGAFDLGCARWIGCASSQKDLMSGNFEAGLGWRT